MVIQTYNPNPRASKWRLENWDLKVIPCDAVRLV